MVGSLLPRPLPSPVLVAYSEGRLERLITWMYVTQRIVDWGGKGGGGSAQKRDLDTLSCDFHSRAKGQRGYSIDKNIGDGLMGSMN